MNQTSPKACKPRFRKLRIAWAVVWGVAASLLVVLWWRSYSWIDVVEIRKPFPPSAIGSGFGIVLARIYKEPVSSRWSNVTYSTKNNERMPTTLGFSAESSTLEFAMTVPYWFVAGIVGVIPVLAWPPPWRFTVRAILIATTLIAVVLGLAAWAANR